MTDQVRHFGARPTDDDLGITDDVIDSTPTGLDALRDELTRDVEVQTIKVKSARPGWTSEHALDFGTDKIDRWRRASKSKAFADGVDSTKFAALCLAATCVAIYRGDQRIVTDDGDPLTLASAELRDMYGKPDAWQTVRAFMGHDAPTVAGANAVIRAAGYDEDGTAVDPTE